VTNAKLEEAIEAVGGVVAVAFYLKRTPASVYKWRTVGRIFDVQDALRLQAVAARAGCSVSIAELGGLDVGDDDPEGGDRAPVTELTRSERAAHSRRAGKEAPSTASAVASAQRAVRTTRSRPASRGLRRILQGTVSA
jgi:hypothetical protein